MANGIVSGLENALGIDTNAGDAQLQAALAALQGVQTPTAAQLTLPQLQQYVIAGKLTPQQYQAILSDPATYSKIISQTQDNTGSDAQKAALQQLGGIVQAGGSTPINQANLLNNVNQTNQAMQSARGAIMDNARQRNVSGGGLEFINQLLNEQGNAQNANLGAVNAASNNAQLALNALAQQGQVGSALQGQSNQASQAQAQAAQQVAEYNSQLANQAAQFNTTNANQAQQMNLANAQDISNQNTGNANMRTQYNAQVPQQVFNDAMQKAGAVAGNYGQQAGLKQQQAQQQNAFTGNLIGAGATMGGSYLAGQAAKQAASSPQYGGANGPDPRYNTNQYGPQGYAMGGEVQCYAQGGEAHDHEICMKMGGQVPGHAKMPGDHAANDTVPARLSPHEIVLPRSVSTAPNAPQKAAQFVQNVKGQPPVNSFREALAKLDEAGLGLHLSPKGI